MKLTGHSNTILYLILGNMERKTELTGKYATGLRLLNRKRVKKGFPGTLLPSFQSQCPPPINSIQGTLVTHQEKTKQRAPTVLLKLLASALRLSSPFSPEANSKGIFRPTPHAKWTLGRRGPCFTWWGKDTHFLTKQGDKRRREHWGK